MYKMCQYFKTAAQFVASSSAIGTSEGRLQQTVPEHGIVSSSAEFCCSNRDCVPQRYSRVDNTGQMLLEVVIVATQITSLCMATGFIKCVVNDAPHIEGGQNFHIYDHISGAPARPLLPKKIEPVNYARANALQNITRLPSALNADEGMEHATCPETVSDDAIPRWMLKDDESGMDNFRDEQACTLLLSLCSCK